MSALDEVVETRHPVPGIIRTANVAAKTLLVLMLTVAFVSPEHLNLEDKAATARAIGYPIFAFTVPAVWWFAWRDRASFPWLADLLVTITCFTDILGNGMDLYDKIVWFDDWIHFMNIGLLAGAVLLLTLHRSAGFGAALERALAFGMTGAVAWELAEYVAFVSQHSERFEAYADTLGDLALGGLGAVLAAVVVHASWRSGRLRTVAPQLEHRPPAPRTVDASG
ncbi:hypothetical protein [Nocardioides pantholopis]|uniref:hypothetical protein n=1 Tax=Nocardioides pantholopis TaxID=2483798 RepID=UPI000F07E8F1|nr:hypothetical protein [Nocardioides pantholopis]